MYTTPASPVIRFRKLTKRYWNQQIPLLNAECSWNVGNVQKLVYHKMSVHPMTEGISRSALFSRKDAIIDGFLISKKRPSFIYQVLHSRSALTFSWVLKFLDQRPGLTDIVETSTAESGITLLKDWWVVVGKQPRERKTICKMFFDIGRFRNILMNG